MTYVHDLAPRTQFVLVDACGCPLAVMEGRYAANADDARFDMADGNAAILLDWRHRGATVVHVSHEEYQKRFYPQLFTQCPHGGGVS